MAQWRLAGPPCFKSLHPLEVPLRRRMNLGMNCLPFPTLCNTQATAGVEGVKEKANLEQGRKSQPRGVPLSQIFTHLGGRGITTNQVVEAPSPPPTCPGSKRFRPWLMKSRAEHGSTRLPFQFRSPHFSFHRHRKPLSGRWQTMPSVSPVTAGAPRKNGVPECRESARVLPDSHPQEMHSFPTCWQGSDREGSHSCECGKAAAEKQFPSSELLWKEKLNTYL